MDSNSNEKKPKRPRIGQSFHAPADGEREQRPRYGQQRPDGEDADGGYRPKRPYQPRQGGYNNNGGYNNGPRQCNNGPRQYSNNGNSGGYRRPYQPRPDFDASDASENAASQGEGENQGYQRPYQPRQYNNGPRQGGYGNGPRQYNNGPRQGGYGNGPRQYNNGSRQGGYGNGPRQYNNDSRQGGYGNGPRQGGYNNGPRQGGYNNGPRQGGYNKNRQQGGAFPARGKSFTPRPKPVEYEMPLPAPDEQIRLNKYMSNAGLCSRREADEFIQQGLVKVNGQVVTELGTKITHSDVVEYDEKVVTLERKCYILLNKPKDCVTTSDDPNGRLTVMDLVKGACNERIYPVGRLDRNTTGVLLLTNDGDLASKLTHPKFVKKKIYHVWCDRDISEDDMQRIADGIELEDGPIHADAISYATETDRNQAGIEIHSGRNRIVRRIFESLGYHVTKLDRVYFAGLTKKNLPRGRWRYLTQEEVNYLKMGSFE